MTPDLKTTIELLADLYEEVAPLISDPKRAAYVRAAEKLRKLADKPMGVSENSREDW